jgi:hypothetical protein
LIAKQLLASVRKNPSHYAPLLEMIRPARGPLIEPLAQVMCNQEDSEADRSFVCSILADFAADRPDLALRATDPSQLMNRFDEQQALDARRAVLLALGEFNEQALPRAARDAWQPRLLQLYRQEPDPGSKASAAWLLRQWGRSKDLAAIDKELAGQPRRAAPGAD